MLDSYEPILHYAAYRFRSMWSRHDDRGLQPLPPFSGLLKDFPLLSHTLTNVH